MFVQKQKNPVSKLFLISHVQLSKNTKYNKICIKSLWFEDVDSWHIKG